MEFFPTAEGYYDYIGKKYVYQYKDHLGNIRLSYAKNPATQVLTIIDENNYYPFGLKHNGYNDYVPTNNKYKYNSKELQDELGLNTYDYGGRNYDPALGRWMNIDPMAEMSRRWSPYNYAYNNPTRFIDPDGMLSQDAIDEMWSKSADDKETKWTNSGNGTFTNGNDAVDASEEVDGSDSGDGGPGDDKKKQEIVKTAKSKDKSTNYSYEGSKDDFGEETNKCNKFVYDILKKTGVAPPLRNGNILKRLIGFGSPVTAGQWADPKYSIPGWEIVSSPEAGDIVAITGNFSNATGHVAIMISSTESIGAGHNEVHVTDFGSNPSHFSDFPGNKGYVYRRYVGGAGGTMPNTSVNPAYKQYP